MISHLCSWLVRRLRVHGTMRPHKCRNATECWCNAKQSMDSCVWRNGEEVIVDRAVRGVPAGGLSNNGLWRPCTAIKVRKVSKQRWVILRHVLCNCKQIGDFAWRAPGVCLAAVVNITMPVVAHAQVVTPIAPWSAPPWSSLDVFNPVPYAKLLSRDPAEAAAPEDNPVKTREQPGYETVGVRAGPWMFSPSLTGGVSYDSNVFASTNDKRGDFAVTIKPSLGVTSLWERHGLDFQGDVRSTQYRRYSQLNQTDASLRARGRIDLWHDAAILTNFRVAALHEGVGSLTSPTGAAEPTPYSLASGDLTYWQRINRLAGSVGIRVDEYNYGSTRAQDGSIINQDSRDGRVAAAHARIDHAISPAVGLFSAIEVNKRDLQGTATQSLSSDGYRSLSGFNVQLGRLVTGEIGAGYASQRFDDPRIGTIHGPAYRAALTWSVTRLLDLHFKAEQIVTEASDTVAGGVRADALQVGADYELRRNLILSVAGTYERDRFFGQLRNDKVYSTLTELKYTLNRYSSISLQHQYFRRDSNVPSSSYDKHEVGVNVTARY